MRAALAARVQAGRDLRAAMRAAQHRGASSNAIAAVLDGHVSRPTVQRILGEPSLEEQATQALRDAGFVRVDEFEIFTRHGSTLLQLEFADEDPVSARHNAASAAMDALRRAGLVAWWDGVDVRTHLADGHAVDICAARP